MIGKRGNHSDAPEKEESEEKRDRTDSVQQSASRSPPLVGRKRVMGLPRLNRRKVPTTSGHYGLYARSLTHATTVKPKRREAVRRSLSQSSDPGSHCRPAARLNEGEIGSNCVSAYGKEE